MKIAVVGGHMAPAAGFIDALPKNVDVVYIGRQHVFEGDMGNSLEYKKITERGIRFISFRTGRIQRSFTLHTIPSLLRLPKGFVQAVQILKKEKPDVVVGFGGYLSVPIGIAAAIRNIPLIIHEQTLDIGLANKILTPFAAKICISWDNSRQYFPKEKIALTGNPMLPFHAVLPKGLLPLSKEKLPLIVISGGSGGSHAINALVMNILPKLLEKYLVIHQTGDAKEFGDFDKLVSLKNTLSVKKQERYSVVTFIDPDSINTLFAKADVAIGRSGINTVLALLILGKKSLLIPLLTGQKNEQLQNAKLLESVGLGKILDQNKLSSEMLLEEIEKMFNKKTMEKPKWGIPIITNGGKNLVKEVLECLSRRRQDE